MKVLTYSTSHGPTVVFLPPEQGQAPDTAAIPAADTLVQPAYSQVAAIGSKASWEQHCQLLVKSPPYAGKWSIEDVPDGLNATAALSKVRYETSLAATGQKEEPAPAPA